MREIKRANAKLAIMERDPKMFGTSLLWYYRATVLLMEIGYWRRRAWRAERGLG